ncbi:RCC1/BLIP-II [Neoconidiobolus thromboides FSU 785]|nr:RCC1/BLIP-II [Neoconidiobolus thromboides FSU 785]
MKLVELPTEVIAQILSELHNTKDLYNCLLTCKLLNNVAKVEEIWKERIRRDYSLLSYVSEQSPIFRKSKFKQLYKALSNPEVFVWGSTENGRSGIDNETLDSLDGMYSELHSPCWLKEMSKKGVSSIVCGGFMMLALTHDKKVYFWGTFNGSVYAYPYSKGKSTPIQLNVFPANEKIEQLSSGRYHALALTEDGLVYQIDNPDTLACLIELSNDSSPIIQIAAGFSSNLVLTKDNKIYYWNYEYSIKSKSYFELVYTLNENEKFIKIAAGDKFSLALTNQGRVIYWATFQLREPETESIGEPVSKWELTHQNSLDGKVLNQVADFKVSHITAQFENFAVFSENQELWIGIIRMEGGIEGDEPYLSIEINLREDLGKGKPIQVSFGDWHTAVLMEEGRLYTWGEHGLGHGQPTSRFNPTTVVEPKLVSYFGDDYFVFYTACAGWHTAALAVNLRDLNATPPEYPIQERTQQVNRLADLLTQIVNSFVQLRGEVTFQSGRH